MKCRGFGSTNFGKGEFVEHKHAVPAALAWASRTPKKDKAIKMA
jgi:hypothetical protein